jgi:hypothetical protein
MFQAVFTFDMNNENFTVHLYNETLDDDAATLLSRQQTDAFGQVWDEIYTDSFVFDATNTSAHTYSIKFKSPAVFSDGVSVDNIVVTQDGSPSTLIPGSYVFRLEDGTEGAGKVLTSDADGNGTWQTPSSPRYSGKQVSGSKNKVKNKLDNDFKQKTNATILKQHTALKDLELEYLKLKKMTNKLIIENK